MRGLSGAEYASTRVDIYNYINRNLLICSNRAIPSGGSGSYFDSL